MKPVTTVEGALSEIEQFVGRPDEFRLPISDKLLDPVGVNMAIITDRILARGWMPDGFEQQDGYRVFRYRELD